MYAIFTYQRYRYDNNDKIDCHVSNCVRKKHPKGVHAFLLEYQKRSPIGFEVLATSCSNCDEESHNP